MKKIEYLESKVNNIDYSNDELEDDEEYDDDEDDGEDFEYFKEKVKRALIEIITESD